MQTNLRTVLVPTPLLDHEDLQCIDRVCSVVGNLSYVHQISFLIVQNYLVDQNSYSTMLHTLNQRTIPDQLVVYEKTPHSFIADIQKLIGRFVQFYQQHPVVQQLIEQLRLRGEYLDVVPLLTNGQERMDAIRVCIKNRTIH